MPSTAARRASALVAVCVAFALHLFASPLRASESPQTILIPESETQAGVLVYPAKTLGPRPITVVLHGMCGEPESTCSHFAELVTERGDHLICPRGRLRCDGGGSTWPVHGITGDVETAVQRALASLAGRVDERRGRTLIGYSLGAFRALSIAESARGLYPSVMLVGARIYPNPRLLRENGVTRLLLAAGDWDLTRPHMQRQAELLARADYPASFLGLGAAGHAFNGSFGSYLSFALDWLQQHD